MAQNFFAAVFRHRGALLLLLGVPIVVFALHGTGLALRSALLGVLVSVCGVSLRLAAIRRIGRGARVHRPHATAGLIAAGPYRWSRNPLYVAAGLMLCGLGLLAGARWIALALFPATLVAYTPVVIAEERALSKLFGAAYTDYLARVPRWLGIPAPRPEASDGPLVPWIEVFRREEMLVPGIAAAVLAIAALREQWIPTRAFVDRMELALDLQDAWLITIAAGLAVLINALKVEWHQRLRRASRAALSNHSLR